MPLGFVLEARVLFDGAIAATAGLSSSAEQSATTLENTAQNTEHTATTESNTHQTEATSNHASTQDTTAENTITAIAADPTTSSKEVVFIDTSVANYQTLVNQMPSSIEVVLLDSSTDGLTQIAEWAKTHSGYDAIHIISHGSEGRVYLGDTTLDSDTVASRQSDLSTIGAALTENGDILLYGCSVASGEGISFINAIANATDADVAASSDLTGAAIKGGNWTLEQSVGTDAIQAHALTFSDYNELLTIVSFDSADLNSYAGIFDKTVSGVTFTFSGKDGYSFANNHGTDYNVFPDSAGNATNDATSLTIAIASGYTFDLTSFSYYTTIADTITVTFTYANNTTVTGTLIATRNGNITVSNFSAFHDTSNNALPVSANDVVQVVIASANGTTAYDFGTNNFDISDVKAISTTNATSTVSAGPSSEATTFSTTATSVANATSLLDFTITDPGTSDGAATTISTFYANVSGTATSGELSHMQFLLSGPDANNVAGTYNSGTGQITFSGLNLSVANASSETYTIKAYYTDNTSNNDITDHHTVILSVNASNFTTVSSSSTFASSQGNVTNGSGASIDVAATKLIYSQSPSVSVVSGINFTTQPVVIAVDDRGNVDTDFNGVVTLSENGSGSLTGTSTITASNGIANFNGVKYTSASDADANFVLTASSGSLTSAASAAINPDVVATRLIFSTQPNPTVIQDGHSTSFTTVPVVQAVDANGMVDQDYTAQIVLSVTDPNDGTVDGTVNSLTVTSGDLDSNGTTISLTPTGGIATYTGLIIQYTNSGSSNTLALRATSGALTAVNSTPFTSTINNAPVFSNLNGGATYTEKGSAVVIDNNVTAADVELDALNNGFGNYNGASITIARNGGSNNDDIFGNSGLLGALVQGLGFTYNGMTVGSVTANTNGTLSLTFNSNATSAIVDLVLQSLTYSNSSYSPPASVTLSWTFSDGSLNSSGSNQAVLSITPVNDAPVISNTAVSKTFNEDTPVTFSASDFGFSDIDSGDTLHSITIVSAPMAGTLFIDANSDGVFGVGDTLIANGNIVSAANISKLTFSPAANANGAGYATFTWTVSDGTVSSAHLGTMTLNVTAVNDAPVISNTAVSKTFNEDTTQSFTASDFGFSDVDSGDTLHAIRIVTAPTAGELFLDVNGDGVRGSGDTLLGNGAIVSAANISQLTFRPAANGNGNGYATFTWTVSDGIDSSANVGTMTLNVTAVNDAPALSSGMTVTLPPTTEDVTSASTLVSSLVGNAGYADVDSGASRGIAITALTGNGIWQYSTDGANWLNVGTVSGSSALLLSDTTQIRYVPDSHNGETATLSFKAWDQTSGTPTAGASKGLADTSTSGGSSAFSVNSAQASLTVTDVNDAPTIANAIGAQSTTEGTSFSFAIPGGIFIDVDTNDTLTLHATQADGSTLPSWLTFNAASGTFSGTPGNGDIGTLTIRVTATDSNNAAVSTTFALTINNANDAPVVSGPLAPQSVAQGASFHFTLPSGTFTDPNIGDTLTLSATRADGAALPAWLTFNAANGTFSGTPSNGDVGDLSIRVTATDGSNASVSTSFVLTVSNVNDAPVASGPLAPQSVAQDANFHFTLPNGTFTDPDSGDILTLSATRADGSALPAWLTFNAANRTFSGTPGNGDVGDLSIRVTAADGSNATASTTFILTVSNVNDAPVVSGLLPQQSVAQDASFHFALPNSTFTDPDSGDTLTLSATQADGASLPAWLTFNAANGTFSGTPGNGDVGNLSIRVTAADGSNASVSTTFTLTISNVNDAPVVSGPLAPQSVAQDANFHFTLPNGTFTDPDISDTLTLSASRADGSALPAWLTFNAANGTFTGTPGNGDVGDLSIRVTATDGSNAAASTIFVLTVSNINDAPVVSGTIPPQNIAQGSNFHFTLPNGIFTDPDSSDTLMLSATRADGSALPSWLTFNAANGTFTGTPGNGDVGILNIKVTASDGNTSVNTAFTLSITLATAEGDPEFRQGGNTTVTIPTTNVVISTLGAQPGASVTLGAIFSPPSLGALSPNTLADTASVTSTIFQSSRSQPQTSAAPLGQIASTFVQGSYVGDASRFESSLGTFSSFNTGGALGGSSSLAGMFSGISLPSISPMEVFSGGSWQAVDSEQGNSALRSLTTDSAVTAFTPDLTQQLQQISDARLQRLAAIEQALLEMDKHSLEAERS